MVAVDNRRLSVSMNGDEGFGGIVAVLQKHYCEQHNYDYVRMVNNKTGLRVETEAKYPDVAKQKFQGNWYDTIGNSKHGYVLDTSELELHHGLRYLLCGMQQRKWDIVMITSGLWIQMPRQIQCNRIDPWVMPSNFGTATPRNTCTGGMCAHQTRRFCFLAIFLFVMIFLAPGQLYLNPHNMVKMQYVNSGILI